MTERKYSATELSEMGRKAYEDWSAQVRAEPGYEEVAAEKDLWLQMVEARMAAGLSEEELAKRMGTTKAQVVRMERNNRLYRLTTLRRYVKALGEGFKLEVKVVNVLSLIPSNSHDIHK